MKSIGSGLQAHFALPSTTTTILVKITRPDGLIYGFTTHDRNIDYLGLTYYAGDKSTDLSDLAHTSGLEVDNAEAGGALNATITEEQVEAGLWSASRIYIYRVNWKDLTLGHEVLGAGELGEVKHDGRGYSVEFMGRTHKLGRIITRHYLPTCDADLGDARCKVDRDALALNGTVASAASARQFTDAGGISVATDYFTYGKVRWLTGANTGREMEIKEQTNAGSPGTAEFELQLSMYYAIAIGDTFTVWPGCNKLLRTGLNEYLGDCKVKFNNVVNFRGFDQIPGIDKILRPAYAPIASP